jgi:hypothetical protein
MADNYTPYSGAYSGEQIDSILTKANTSETYTSSEKTKLSTLFNYDDTLVKADISDLKSNKVDKISGKGLSTNDYTTDEKQKLDDLENYYTRNPSTTVNENSDLNSYKTPGRYGCNTGSIAATIINAPYSTSGYRLEVIETTGNNLMQKLYPNNLDLASGAYYMRTYASSTDTWTSWYKYQGEIVT